MPILVYPAFLAAAISVAGLTNIALTEHDSGQPRTLSELAAAEENILKRFRKILFICGTLLAITCYGYILPKLGHVVLFAAAWTLTYVCNLLSALVPARDKTLRMHEAIAQGLGTGMQAMAYLFWIDLSGGYAVLEICIALSMTSLGFMTFVDRKRFLLYELPFIFLSHASILIAIIAFLNR